MVVTAPDRGDTLTFKKYVTEQSSSFRFTEIGVLNFGSTPLHLLLKSTNENRNFFAFQSSDFYGWIFILDIKLWQRKLLLNAFQGLLKLQKKYVEKIKGTPPYLTCNSIDQNLPYFIFLVKICSGATAPSRVDAAISKKYVTVQCNPF